MLFRKPPPRRPAPPCPDCGGPLSLEGTFCRKCGWDASLMESEESYLDGVDLPEGEEDAEGGRQRPLLWTVVAVILVLAMLRYWVF